MTAQNRNLRLENIGPIDHLSIPLPDAGVVVLRGRNGVGKSHALAAVDALLGGRGRPPCKDHARKGVIEGAGARLTIGRSTRRTGEAEVVTLEGRLDISQLVQPPIKDEESADRTRIKALIQLSGASADPQGFARILPEGTELGELLAPADVAGDPVIVAGKIKRALEAEARRHDKAAEDAAAKAAGCQAQCAELTPEELELDRSRTEQTLQKALLAQRELQTRAQEAERRQEQAENAKQTLDKLRCEAPIEQSIEGLTAEEAALTDKIQRLQQALAVAQERRQGVRRQLDQLRTVQSQIEELERLLADVPELVSASELQAAAVEVDLARQTHDRAIEVERWRQLAQQADAHRQQAQREQEAAGRLREAAHATDDVLTDLVGRVTKRLRVDAGRMVCDTDRGPEPFSELSPGERWRIALEIAVEQVGQGGLVTVPQECWEGLDPVNRSEVARIARSVGVVLLTAEADEHELITAEVVEAPDASGGHEAVRRAAEDAIRETPR